MVYLGVKESDKIYDIERNKPQKYEDRITELTHTIAEQEKEIEVLKYFSNTPSGPSRTTSNELNYSALMEDNKRNK